MTQEAIKEQIRQALDHRVAVRVYDENRDISRQDMEVILDAAWLSPSSVGLEGWRFLVLDRGQVQAIRPDLQPLGCPTAIGHRQPLCYPPSGEECSLRRSFYAGQPDSSRPDF